MRVFMLGWEFPPFISGGLGTACYGLTRGLDEVGVKVCFVLPTAIPVDDQGAARRTHVELRTPADLPKGTSYDPNRPDYEFQNLEVHRLAATLQAYAQPTGEIDEDLCRLREQAGEEVAKLTQFKEFRHKARDEKAKQVLRHAVRTAAQIGEKMNLPNSGSRVVGGAGIHYGTDLMTQIHRYAQQATQLAVDEPFDVVHAHDWMTFPAGLAVSATTGKPLVAHVHSTEFDRSGDNVNQQVYDIERAGMHAATKVVCVSHLTRSLVINRYSIPPEKVTVVYNAVDVPESNGWNFKPIERDEKIVLFLGRITMQKGPEYFLRAARKVVDKYEKVRFVMAGSGDMIQQCIREAADLKLGRYVTFTGFLRGGDVSRIFQMADLYVMPSVSEPFGIAPLEAISHNVPVIISRQSGVSEVLTHVLKVDFWDIDEMANKILAVLRHEALQSALREHGRFELSKLSWADSARQVKDLYQQIGAHG